MSHDCPKCNGVIYNRRMKTCGYCGAELPAELLFSAAELEMLDKEEAVLAAFRQQQKAEFEAEEQKRQEAAKRQGAFMSGYFLGKIS